VLNLAEYGRIRVMADRLGVDTLDREGRLVVIRFRPQAKVDPARLVRVVGEWPGAVFVPPVSLKLDLDAPGAARASKGHAGHAVEGAKSAGSRRGRGGDQPSSWWTARATAGAVTAGFTKDEMLKRPDADPRAPGGMCARLEGLLRALGA
jgi:hypothetical protein